MIEMSGKTGDLRGFLHKRIIGAVGGFLGGGPLGAVGGFIGGGGGGGARPPTQLEVSRANSAAAVGGGGCARLGPGAAHDLCVRISRGIAAPTTGRGIGKSFAGLHRGLAPQGNGTCPGFSSVRIAGKCVNLGDLGPGGPRAITDLVTTGGMANEVVMGRYGAAYVPGSRIIDRAVCLRGDIVGDDGLCYPKKSLTNKERMWPKGRQPLLTGGEMRAISIAARTGRRVEGATKRLQKIGLMKKPSPRKAATAAAVHHSK